MDICKEYSLAVCVFVYTFQATTVSLSEIETPVHVMLNYLKHSTRTDRRSQTLLIIS